MCLQFTVYSFKYLHSAQKQNTQSSLRVHQSRQDRLASYVLILSGWCHHWLALGWTEVAEVMQLLQDGRFIFPQWRRLKSLASVCQSLEMLWAMFCCLVHPPSIRTSLVTVTLTAVSYQGEITSESKPDLPDESETPFVSKQKLFHDVILISRHHRDTRKTIKSSLILCVLLFFQGCECHLSVLSLLNIYHKLSKTNTY